MNRRRDPGRGSGEAAAERRVRGCRLDGHDRLSDVAVHGRGAVQGEKGGEGKGRAKRLKEQEQ
jgi:hypothetical protein